MRTHLVFAAKEQMPNRFELAIVATLFARRTHKPNTRMAISINKALERISVAPGESEGEQ